MCIFIPQFNFFFSYYITIFVLVSTTCYIVAQLLFYRSAVDRQNMHVIRIYFDQKFISKIIAIIGDYTKETSDSIYEEIKSNILKYFQLDDIIIYNTDTSNDTSNSSIIYRSQVLNYVANNLDHITKIIKKDVIMLHTLWHYSKPINISIIALEYNNCNTLIICIQYTNNYFLDHHEINTLTCAARTLYYIS